MITNNKPGRAQEQSYIRVRDKLRDAFEAGRTGKPFDAELASMCGENALFAEMVKKQRLAGSKAGA